MSINGVFDNKANKKYNDALPDYDVEDCVDNVKCDNDCCPYRDIDRKRCLFETCILNQFPISIPYHTKFTCKCKICNKSFNIEFQDYQHPLFDIPFICDKCISKLKALINGTKDGDINE